MEKQDNKQKICLLLYDSHIYRKLLPFQDLQREMNTILLELIRNDSLSEHLYSHFCSTAGRIPPLYGLPNFTNQILTSEQLFVYTFPYMPSFKNQDILSRACYNLWVTQTLILLTCHSLLLSYRHRSWQKRTFWCHFIWYSCSQVCLCAWQWRQHEADCLLMKISLTVPPSVCKRLSGFSISVWIPPIFFSGAFCLCDGCKNGNGGCFKKICSANVIPQ